MVLSSSLYILQRKPPGHLLLPCSPAAQALPAIGTGSTRGAGISALTSPAATSGAVSPLLGSHADLSSQGGESPLLGSQCPASAGGSEADLSSQGGESPLLGSQCPASAGGSEADLSSTADR